MNSRPRNHDQQEKLNKPGENKIFRRRRRRSHRRLPPEKLSGQTSREREEKRERKRELAMAGADVETLDFELEEDDLMDEEAGGDAPPPKLKSAITGGAVPRKTKGRGFREEADERQSRLAGRDFESLGSEGGPGPQRSIEGWITLVTGVHEEAQEDDVHNVFSEYGQIKNLHLNLDRRSGYVKGYALIEYEQFEEAQKAIAEMNGATLLTQIINVDWAFSNGPSTGDFRRKNMRPGRTHRSRSPRRRY